MGAEDMCAKHLGAVFVSVCQITKGSGTRDIEITCKLPAAPNTSAAASTRATSDSPAGLATASVSAANNDQFKVTAAPAPTSTTSAAAVFAPIAVLVALFAVVASLL
eukprot:Amastigsp_a508715_223.p2 type:complete len:107 gc:universal Amastigsp_a508715_223:1-321(+)